MTTTQTDRPLVDTSVMKLLHDSIRGEFGAISETVPRVGDGERARVDAITDHLHFLLAFLHHHHTIEDEMVWPTLRGRVSGAELATVELMEDHHARLSVLLDGIADAIPAWRATPAAAERDVLAALLDELLGLLREHLAAEEQHLLPIAARAMTHEEWDRMGDEGRRRTPRAYRSLTLGMFARYGDPEVFATIAAAIPRPVRGFVLRGARRTYRRRATLVYGGASV